MASHLLESTIFAIAAALVAWLLRHERAAIRHGVWIAASTKFLVPFGSLVALGHAIGRFIPSVLRGPN